LTELSLPQPTIWINLSTSEKWTRPAVGIVRLEQAMSEQLRRLYGPRVRTCVWRDSEFIAWPEVPSKRVSWSDRWRKPAARLARQWKRAEEYDGASGRPPVEFPRSTSFDLSISRRRSSRAPDGGRREDHSAAYGVNNPASADFNHGDILITVGRDWDEPYFDQLYFLKLKTGIKIVACCYDLIPVLFPQYVVGEVAAHFRRYFSRLTWTSDLIFCISETTRADYAAVCTEMGAPVKPAVVIRLGDNTPSGVGDISDEVRRICERRYILFVSTIERRKNHEVIYRAYHLLAAMGRSESLPKVVFVGMYGWGVEDLMGDIRLDPMTKGLFVQLNHVNDAELALLYEHAMFCVFPSLYEGWGLPVGEALALGKAVISSGCGSLREVGGDLVIYVDPWSPAAWAEKIAELIDDPDQIKSIEERVVAEYRPVGWTETGRQVFDALEALAAEEPAKLILWPGYDLGTGVGVHWGAAIRSCGEPGDLVSGPGRPLPPGAYEVSITYRALGGASGNLDCRVVSACGDVVHHQWIVWLGDRAEASDLSVERFRIESGVADFETVVTCSAGVQVEIETITVERL
jgi:glycosyltransferase involved in cell wall biosynthesis